MIWLSWRLHRAAVLTFIAVIGGLVALYLVDANRLHSVYAASGLEQCIGVLNNASCAARRQVFLTYDVGLVQYTQYLLVVVTGALGAFLGAPLVSTEFERGTWQWIWTQRISRTRWLAVNFAVVAVIIAALGAALGTAYTWWDRPLAAQVGPFALIAIFDNTPLMCAVYSVFAFAVGVTASAFLRRTLGAMAVTGAVFLLTRFSVVYWLRPHYMAPIAVDSAANEAGAPLGFDARDWDFSGAWLDASGHEVSSADVSRLTSSNLNPAAAGHPWYEVLQQNGIHYHDLVQPYQRAGTFQLIEAAIYLALIAVCASLAFWRIRHRNA
jgi:ABC-type transport system involved in multi-copper enzyme maturation permease subunit